MYRPDLRNLAAWLAAEPPARFKVDGPAAALAALLPLLTDGEGRPLEVEHFAVLALGPRGGIIDAAMLTRGSARATVVDPAQVYRWALTRARLPAGIVVGHNHPSGDPSPSSQDIDTTRRLAAAGRTVGVALHDHIVVGEAGRFTSLAEQGYLSGV